MVIKALKKIKEIKKSALAYAWKQKKFNVSVKSNLSERKKRELIKLLGDKADKFLEIEDYNYRAHFYRGDIENLPDKAIAVYAMSDLEGFVKLSSEDINPDQKRKLKHIEREMEKI